MIRSVNGEIQRKQNYSKSDNIIEKSLHHADTEWYSETEKNVIKSDFHLVYFVERLDMQKRRLEIMFN